MRSRWRSFGATFLTLVLIGGIAGTAHVAQAAVPPFEPDPNAEGCLHFYDANGNVILSGNINDIPIAAYAQGSGAARPGDDTATLFGASPEPGQQSQVWLTEQITADNTFPSSTAPRSLANSPNPLYVGDPGDLNMGQLPIDMPHPATDNGTPYQGLYQIRLITSGPTGADPKWWRADVQITGNTWTQVFCPGADVNSTTTLTVSPSSPQTAGTTVDLTATVAPSTATGTVQFRDGTSNLGQSVSVTAATATLSTSSLAVGSRQLLATFIPTDPTAINGSTSNSVAYEITAADLAIVSRAAIFSGPVRTRTA